MESELVKGLAQLGGFGLLAAIIFWYSQRAQQKSEERIKELADGYKELLKQSNTLIESNTSAMTKLCVLVEAMADQIAESNHPIRTVMRKTGSGNGD